jgi:hypothetical protein
MANTKRKTAPAKPAKPGNGKAKTARKARAAKPSAEQLSDQERQRLLLAHRRRLKPLLLAEANAKAAVTKAFELAKKEGVTKKDITLAIQAETEEGEAKIRAEIERVLTVTRWVGSDIGVQLDLFPKASAAEQAFEDGKRTALDDKPRKPPNGLSQAGEKRWFDGFDQGRVALNESRAQGFTPLADAAKKITERAGVNGASDKPGGGEGAPPAPVGTEPATHQIAA